MLAAYPWREFLTEWSNELIASQSLTNFIQHFGKNYPHTYTSEIIRSGWLGYAGATEAELAFAEKRLGKTLPPSYREFLKTTNGWRYNGTFIPRIWSTEQIEWLIVSDPDLAYSGSADDEPVPDEDYFVYGKGQSELTVRWQYLETTLDISAREIAGSAKYLLNPQIITPDGEWEAWFYAHWLPGATRYRSFWDLMQAEYKTFVTLEECQIYAMAHPPEKKKRFFW